MPPVPIVLPACASGELSPRLHGRVDVAKYQTGMAAMLNWYVANTGGAVTRAGLAWVGEVYDSTARSRLVSFQFSQVQAYILEFANQAMRVIMNGGYVLNTAINISAITNANPGVVTANSHGFSNGDNVWIAGVVGMTQINRRRFVVAGATTNTFQLSGINTSAYGTYISGGTVASLFTLGTPYLTADLALLKFVQSADTLTITHPAYQPRDLTRTSHTAWTLTAITFAPTQLAPTGFTSSDPGATFSYAITAENDQTGEESRILTGSSNGTASVLTWASAPGSTIGNVYRQIFGIYGLIGRGASFFQDATITPDVSQTPPQARSPFSGSDFAGDFPGCATYHDGRKWFARTNAHPQTLYATQSASFNNMDVSDPGQDSDAIVEQIASREVNEIRFLMSLDQLLVFTSGAVWKAWPGSQVDVITPINLSVKPQIYDGIAQIPPIGTGETSCLYVTASGKRMRDIQPNGYGGYTTNLVSVLSQHLFKGTLSIQEVAYAKDPDGIVWCVRSDGVMLGFTYLAEQQIYAWTRHTTLGIVESVAVAQESNETILYIAVARTIGGVTKRYVERMSTRVFATVNDAFCVDSGYTINNWNTTAAQTLTIAGATYNAGDTVTLTAAGFTPFTDPGSIGQQYILRDAASQSQVSVTITAFTSSSSVSATLDIAPFTSLQNVAISDYALGMNSMGGLWHLEGQTVKVFADGSVEPDALVTNGTIALAHVCGRVVAGLGYACDLETLDIEAGAPTIQGKYKRVSEVTLRLEDTRGLSVGPTFDRMTEIKERSTEAMGWPTQLTTGDEKITIDPLWNSNGRVCIRQANPLPAMIAAIIPKLDVGT